MEPPPKDHVDATLLPDRGRVETLIPDPASPPGVGPGPGPASRYQFLKLHAEGGLGKVWVARDGDLNREVALKEVRPEWADRPDSLRRFLREAQVTGQLEHPNIVPVYELARRPEDGQPFYTMRLLRGRTLLEEVADHHGRRAGGLADPLARQKLLSAFVAVCQAIGYAHSRGVIHRDLKPENVMIGGFGEVVVLDWGLARMVGRPDGPADLDAESPSAPDLVLSPEASALTTRGAVGTPAYMSPEQAEGDPSAIDARSDIYGLGAILFEILAGRPPFEGRDLAEVYRRIAADPTPRARDHDPAVPRAIEAVALKAMAKEPGGRYVRAADLADDVQRFLAGEPVSAYREPWTIRARRWMGRHRVAVTSTAAASAVAALALGVTLAGNRARGIDLVDALESAEITKVPAIVEQLDGHRWWADPRLAGSFRARPEGSPEKLRASLGLLPVDRGQVDYLVGRLLEGEPRELVVIRDSIRKADADVLVRRLWEVATRDETLPPARFRAACGLAVGTVDDPRWEALGPEVVRHLMGENRRDPVGTGLWIEALGPALARLARPLVAVYIRPGVDPSDRSLASRLLRICAREPGDLVALIGAADPEDFEAFVEKMKAVRPAALGLLERAAGAPGTPESDDRARGRAQAAAALARLGKAESTWPMLRHGPDPTARSHLIDRLAPLGVAPSELLGRFRAEPDPSARRAIVLALGQFTDSQLPAGAMKAYVDALTPAYRDDPDPGIHSAIDWLLRGWGVDQGLRSIDAELAGRPRDGRSWSVNRLGQTYAVLENPGTFVMGSPMNEEGRERDEAEHRRRIGHSFAIATREVTFAEFIRLRQERPELVPLDEGQLAFIRRFSPHDPCPMPAAGWFGAILYCRWLSEKEGIPEDQMCYPGLDQIKTAWKEESLPEFPEDFLEREGYRLPTEAEWEYACRAGARARWYFGSSPVLLPRYAWLAANSGSVTHPVGLLKPNDFGLFDIIGNLREFCQDTYRPYEAGRGDVVVDRLVEDTAEVAIQKPTRGGSCLDSPGRARSALRNREDVLLHNVTSGFRPARTVR